MAGANKQNWLLLFCSLLSLNCERVEAAVALFVWGGGYPWWATILIFFGTGCLSVIVKAFLCPPTRDQRSQYEHLEEEQELRIPDTQMNEASPRLPEAQAPVIRIQALEAHSRQSNVAASQPDASIFSPHPQQWR